MLGFLVVAVVVMFSVRSVRVPADRRTSATFLAGSPGGQQASAFR